MTITGSRATGAVILQAFKPQPCRAAMRIVAALLSPSQLHGRDMAAALAEWLPLLQALADESPVDYWLAVMPWINTDG